MGKGRPGGEGKQETGLPRAEKAGNGPAGRENVTVCSVLGEGRTMERGERGNATGSGPRSCSIFGIVPTMEHGERDLMQPCNRIARLLQGDCKVISFDYLLKSGILSKDSHDHRLCRWFIGAPPGHFVVPPKGGVW